MENFELKLQDDFEDIKEKLATHLQEEEAKAKALKMKQKYVEIKDNIISNHNVKQQN